MIPLFSFDEIKNKRNRFISQTLASKDYLKKYNVSVSYKGYSEIWDKYFNIDTLDMDGLFILSKELIMWKNYFSNLYCVFNMKKESNENKILYLESFRTERRNTILEKNIEVCYEELVFFRDYSILLKKQEKDFNNATKHCLQLYEEGIRNYNKIS